MSADRWQKVSRIYHDALALAPAAREGFIRAACDGDEEIEQELRSLLAQSSSDSFLAVLPPRGPAVGHVSRPDLPSRLGRFECRGLLGAGGMGEVYRAHDPDLGRYVAIKIVPAAFANDPDRLARLEREARVLATLSHPNIAAIYGVEEITPEDGDGSTLRALVLELVEGATLADRLRDGPIPLAETREIMRQIADALEAAHDKGVVHRDLKPANVKIRADGLVKVLDFGLAKAEGSDRSRDSATVEGRGAAETAIGAILGTPAYMSPEQARGLPVDKRADIWAFGCVLYEMLCARPAFRGDTPSDVLAAVLHREPDWSALPRDTPSSMRRLVHRCLEQNPKRRLRDIGDTRLDLEPDPFESGPASARPSGVFHRAGWGVATAALVLVAILTAIALTPRTALPPVRFTLSAGAGQVVAGVPVPSPDGRQLVFVARTLSGESALWVRPLGSSEPRRLAGTENAVNPFWSPDSSAVGFIADGMLKRTALPAGPVQRVTSLDPTALGATWNNNNVIVFTPSNRVALHRVSASGGEPEPLTVLNAERRENSHRWPQFLPDGRHFLYTARSDLPEHTAIYVASLERPQSPRRLVAAQSGAIYVSTGYLVFARDNTLVAQRFDVDALALEGEPFAIAGDVAVETPSARGGFAASADGTVLTYITDATSRLVWFDRDGVEVSTIGAEGDFNQVRLAPDGSHAAVVLPDPQNGNRDVWVVTLANGALSRLTSHPASDWFPVWSPDGAQVLFASDRNETPAFYRAATTGVGGEQLVFNAPSPVAIFPTDWSPDGRSLVFHSYPRGDISLLPIAPGATPVPLVESPFTDWIASFSPNGRWIAYVSDESGTEEVYVRDLAGTVRHRVSAGGGVQPRWRRDGRELLFLSGDGKLMSMSVSATTTFVASVPRPLFTGCGMAARSAPFMYRYDITPDAARSLWICGGREPMVTVAVHALTSRRD